MIKEAEQNAENDAKKRESIEAANAAEGMIHDTEKAIEEFKTQLDKEELKKIEERIVNLRKTIQSGAAADAIKSETSELQQASLKLFETAYKVLIHPFLGADIV